MICVLGAIWRVSRKNSGGALLAQRENQVGARISLTLGARHTAMAEEERYKSKPAAETEESHTRQKS
jgi:hypothetical protein